MSMTQTMTPADLLPAHEIRDDDKLAALTASMREHGWHGAPIVIAKEGYGDQALTGSHRLAAAEAADIEVPVVDIRTLAADHGHDFDELVQACGDLFDAARRLADQLPADVTAYYGLDLH